MVVAETDREGNEKAYFTRGDELLSMDREGKVCYYHYDGHGNVRFLTDGDGKVTDSYSYDAYGNLLQKKGDTENEFLYTGEQYNANTGLYYLRARYMDPSTGTFTSMDSWPGSISDPVSLHKYLYANANPVTYSDPSGHMAFMLAEAGALSCSEVQESPYNSVVVHIGQQILSRLRALKEIQQISYIASSVLIAIVVEGIWDDDYEFNPSMTIAVELLEAAIDNLDFLCEEAGINGDSIAAKVSEALYQTKNKGKSGEKRKKEKTKEKDKPRSKNPPARRYDYSSKKEAYEAAKRAGKGKEPIHHPNDPGQRPHYHPNVENSQRLTPKGPCSHDHFYY